jgi:hypothetical protein
MKKYYDYPTQIIFKERLDVTDEPRWIGGIAYRDEVICGECGGIILLEDIEEIIDLPWTSISEEIGGDELLDKAD